MEQHLIKLLITIVDRGKGAKAAALYRSEHIYFNYICLGLGTANSEILDYFGLSETQKDVVFTPAPAVKLHSVMKKAGEHFRIMHPGMGILCALPLSGVSGHIPKSTCRPEFLSTENGGKEVEASVQYDLILTIVNHGCTDTVMRAARAAGAGGGTVLHAREVGEEDIKNLLGITIEPEREIVMILSPRAQKQAIMQAVNKAAGLATNCRGVLFSLPVDAIMGLHNAETDV